MRTKEAWMYAMSRYEAKIIELMPDEEAAAEFIFDVSREAFRIDCEQIEDSEFKKFCLDNLEQITQGRLPKEMEDK